MFKNAETSTPLGSPNRIPHVMEELGYLDKAIYQLDEATGLLGERLTPVLCSSPDALEKAPDTEPYRVPLAQSIHEKVEQVQTISRRILGMIERLEI